MFLFEVPSDLLKYLGLVPNKYSFAIRYIIYIIILPDEVATRPLIFKMIEINRFIN